MALWIIALIIACMVERIMACMAPWIMASIRMPKIYLQRKMHENNNIEVCLSCLICFKLFIYYILKGVEINNTKSQVILQEK